MGKVFVYGMGGLITVGLIFLLWFGGTILWAWGASLLRAYRSGKR